MSKKQLLVIDDERAQRETLAGFLRKRGYSVRTAADGDQGLREVRREAPDLVLTDMNMPGLGGQELLEAIGLEMPHVAVIIITAFGNIDTAVAAMQAGAFTFLGKPVDLDQLEVTIERALEHRFLVAENETLRREIAGRDSFAGIISGSGEMEEVLSLVARVAPAPSGTQ